VFVSVGCRVGNSASQWRREEDAAEVRLLTTVEQKSLRQRIGAINALPAEPEIRNILIAGAYAGSGVRHAAWQRYTESNTPAAWVTAGDLAFAMELDVFAVRDYTRALGTGSSQSVHAAAELGLGRVALARRSFREAYARFETAVKSFVALGLESEAAEARDGLQRSAALIRELEMQ
jgi:hypothetical protein